MERLEDAFEEMDPEVVEPLLEEMIDVVDRLEASSEVFLEAAQRDVRAQRDALLESGSAQVSALGALGRQASVLSNTELDLGTALGRAQTQLSCLLLESSSPN